MIKLFFLGKDKRSEYLKRMYEKDATIEENIEEAEFVVLPIPFSIKLFLVEQYLKNLEECLK